MNKQNDRIASKKVVKVVLFDLMGEYTVLLADQLLKLNTGRILTIGRNTLPEGLFKYINKFSDAPSLEDATKQLKRYTLLPKALIKERQVIDNALKQIIENEVIRVYQRAKSLTVWDVFYTNLVKPGTKRVGESQKNQQQKIKSETLKNSGLRGDRKKIKFTPELAITIKQALQTELEKKENKSFEKDFSTYLTKLEELENSTEQNWVAGTSLDEIIEDLNDDKTSSLWIVQAHNPNELREFSKRLGDALYEKRRQNGTVDPLVSFIFDEADEFIPGKPQGKSYEASKEIVETLARRGRKFGIGIGIATQRTRYLDTSIMAQPHTYLVSKLPRDSDRDVVAEAFGVSKDMFRQTFKFKPGNWLIMSHDATGLKAIPVPIQTKDANQRIVKNLKSLQENEDEF